MRANWPGLDKGARDFSTKYLENLGMLKARTQKSSAPLVIGDFASDLLESIDNGAAVIHLTIPVRDAAGLIKHPDVQREITNRWGRGFMRGLEEYVVEGSTANERIRTPSGRLVSQLNRWAASSILGLNPGSWLRNLGGLPRVAAFVDGRDFAYGMAHFNDISLQDLVDNSGYFWDRYVSNIAGRFSPTQVDGMSMLTRQEFTRGYQIAGKNLRAGDLRGAVKALQEANMSTLQILNFFDSVNARIAVAAKLNESRRTNPARSEEEHRAYAYGEAAEIIRETQNSSRTMDMPLVGLRGRDDWVGLVLLFSSDLFKARNRLKRAAHQGRGRLARIGGAEALNVAWSRGVGVGMAFLIQGLVIAMFGDEDDWEKLKKDTLRIDRNLASLARDAVGLIDPVVLPRFVDAAAFGQSAFTDTPVTGQVESVNDAFQQFVGATKAYAAGDTEKGNRKMLRGLEDGTRDLLAVFGLNPFQQLWRSFRSRMRKIADRDEAETQSNDRRRRQRRDAR